MTSKTGVSIYQYNGMKGRLVRALTEIDRIKGIDRSYANLATFILDHLESKKDSTVISQEIPKMPSENEIIMQSPSLTNIFIDNMLENSKIDTDGEGNRYREEVYDIANMVRSNSLKIYEMIKDIFCFPSEKSLDTKFSKSTNDTISFITDINLINEIINQYRKNICNENDVIPAILGVDACSFDRLFHKNKKYAFVFYLQPVNPAYPCLPLHITPHQNGFANCEIIQKIVLINKKLADEGIRLIGVSTDGDPNYNEVNETTFKIYEDCLKNGNFADAYTAYSNHEDLKYFGDLLHILKLARSRILTTYVTVRVDSLEYSFTACDIEPILQLGPALTDITKTGKMRDCYTQQLFTMKNLQKLIDAEMFGAAVYFLPFCLWSSAIFVQNLSRQSRLFLLQTAFEIFYGFYLQSIEQKKIAEVTTNSCLTTVAVCFAQKYFMIRCLNSTMAVIYTLNNFPEVGLDRLGTHCLEQYFGNVRSMCHGYDSYENIIKNCVKTLQNMNTCAKYNIRNTTHGRINMAGAKMLEEENSETIYLDGIDCCHPQLIAAAFFGLVGEVGLKFKEIGGPFGPPPPNDPEQVALSEALLRCKQSISQMPSDSKKVALQYFEGDDRTGAALDIVNEWSYQIPKTYKKGNNSNSAGAKIFVRSISVSADEAQNQIKLHEQTFPQSAQPVQKFWDNKLFVKN